MNLFSLIRQTSKIAMALMGHHTEGQFVDENDPTAISKKVHDPDTAVYILNEKLQVKFESHF